jgi:signal transduction histidine kinase
MAESVLPREGVEPAPVRREAPKWVQRLRIDNLGTFIIALVMLIVIVLNGASLVFYFVFREDAAVAAAAGQAADQVIAVRRLVERAPQGERSVIIRRMNSPALAMAVTRRPIVQLSDEQFSSRVVLNRLSREFPPGTEIHVDSRIDRGTDPTAAFPSEEEIERHMRDDMDEPADLRGPPPDAPMTREERRDQRDQRMKQRDQRMERFFNRPSLPLPGPEAIIRVSVRVGESTWFNARISLAVDERPSRSTPIIVLSAMALFVAIIALWGVRRATKPLALFANAAERLGVDVNADPLAEEGPGEVRRAARAFNTMQTRLKRFVQDRTQMLAAISHDLRTPITRMKLRAEFVDDDDQRNKMLSDLDDMEAMIAATLAFARDDAANEPTTTLDLAKILGNVAADSRAAGHDVTFQGPSAYDITARPLALKRAITNLVDNAVKYGKRARVTLNPGSDLVEVLVDDDGPGIASADAERVFAPFVRLETSRSRETGGTGLGLTISRNAIRSMGGDVELINRTASGTASSGLRVRVTLPATKMA